LQSGVRDARDGVLWFNNGSGRHLKPEPFFAPSLLAVANARQGLLSRQVLLIKAFLMRPTATVMIAPVTPPPAKFPSAAPMSKPPPLAALLRAGIRLCRRDPPIPPPAAPEIVLTRGLRSIFLRKPPAHSRQWRLRQFEE